MRLDATTGFVAMATAECRVGKIAVNGGGKGLAVAGVNQNSVGVVFNQLGYCTCARGIEGSA